MRRREETETDRETKRDCFFLNISAFKLALSSACQSPGRHSHTNKLNNEIFISYSELLTRVMVCGGSGKEETAGRDERMERGERGRETVCQQVLKKSETDQNTSLSLVECFTCF